MGELSPVGVALNFVELINQRDLDGLMGLMTVDHTFIDLGGDVHPGKDVQRRNWGMYFEAYPTYMIYIKEIYLVDDMVILVGRTTGSHVDLPREIEILDTVIWRAKVSGSKIAEWRIFEDTLEMRGKFHAVEETRVV
jgi:hypothetical protein